MTSANLATGPSPAPASMLRRASLLSAGAYTWILRLLNVFLTLILFRLYSDGFLYAPVNDDAGYYIPTAFRLAEGKLPVADINLGYTPLLMYVFAILAKVVGSGNTTFSYFLGVVFLFQFGSAFLVYRIAGFISQKRALRYFSAALALLCFYIHEGDGVFLEPPTAFFALLGAMFLLNPSMRSRNFLLAGFCGFLSFFTKQYGLASLFAYLGFCFLIPRPVRERVKLAALVLVGFSFPLVVVVFAWLSSSGLSLKALSTSTVRTGYLSQIINLSSMGEFFLHTCWFMLLSPLLLFSRKMRISPSFQLTALLCIGFTFPLFVRPFLHYFGLIIPYVALLGLFLCEATRRFSPALAIIFLSIFSPLIAKAVAIKPWKDHPNARAQQIELAHKINEIWPPGTRVLVFGEPSIFFTCGFLPIDSQVPGYSFLVNFAPQTINEMFAIAERVLIDRESVGYFTNDRLRIEAELGDFDALLAKNGYRLTQSVENRYEFWERGK